MLSRLFLVCLVSGVIAALVFAFLPEPIDVDVITVSRGDLLVTVDEDGKTRIREKYVISAPLAGRLERIELERGDPVVTGETLMATITPKDPDLLDARAIALAEARVRAAETAVAKSSTLLRQAIVSQADAETDLARLRKLERRNATTQSELEDAELLLTIRGEDVRGAKYAEEIARFELAQAEAALVRSRPPSDEASPSEQSTDDVELRRNEWNFPIYAPVNGRVLGVIQESAAVVNAGAPLIELGDPTDLEVEIDVLSIDAVKVHPGAEVLLERWGGERTLRGKVRLVEPSAFTKISTLGVEEQRVNIIVDLLDPPDVRPELGDGFRVEARIVVDEAKDILLVPQSSLFRIQDQWALFRLVEGRAQLTPVEVGRQNGLMAELISGVTAGEQVLLRPNDKISDGTIVRIRVTQSLLDKSQGAQEE